MVKVVGFHGEAGSGKDTAALALPHHLPLRFAGPVYAGVSALNPWIKLTSGEFVRINDYVLTCGGWDKAKEEPEVRQTLQRYGTEAGREIHGADCWIRPAAQVFVGDDNVKALDVRFDNEAKLIHRHGGIIIHIVGPQRREGVDKTHTSESGISPRLKHYVIYNTGTIKDLHDHVLKCATSPIPNSTVFLGEPACPQS